MKSKRRKRNRIPRVSRETQDWLEHHSMQDMKELVCELSAKGEDVSELVEAVNKLEEIADQELDIQEELTIPTADGTRKKLEEVS